VAAAKDLVNKNPADPYAHLQLSLSFWDSGQFRPSFEELAQAANLAGPFNRAFFTKAAEEFKSREAWVATAGINIRLYTTYQKDPLPKDVEENLHESIYKASEQKDMPLYVFFEKIDSINLPLGYIARGRYALFNGDITDAKTQLANAQKVAPDMYEVFLLQAEVDFKDGKRKDAKNILLSLSSDLGAPEWIRLMAENFLKTLQ
jgi:hypothetical protein